MKEFTLSKAGGTAKIEILGGNALPEVLALQDATQAALPDDKKRFILVQGTAYFQNLLMRQTGLMLGVRIEGKLIGQMAMCGPLELREAIARNLITKNSIPFHHAALTDHVVVFKSLTTHPDWRGNDLAHHLISYALEMPFIQITEHVFAQVSVANRRSWDVFARQGFGIVAAAYDPEDGKPRFVFQRPSFGFDFAPEIIADDVDPTGDFPAIVALTQREALIGVLDRESPGKLAFLRNRELLNLMPVLAKVSGRR